jgi:hypothetical protein
MLCVPCVIFANEHLLRQLELVARLAGDSFQRGIVVKCQADQF